MLSASLTGLYQERIEDEILYANGGKDLESYRASLYLTPNDADTFTLDYAYHDQKRVHTEGKTRTSTSETNNNRNAIGLAHSGNYLWGNGNSYLSRERVENVGRELEVENTNANTQWSLSFIEHLVTLGAAFEQQQLDNQDYVFRNSQWSLFAEDEWYLSDSFTLTAGLRYDNNQQFSSQFSHVFTVCGMLRMHGR